VGLNYAMTRSWGFDRRSFGAYTVATNVVDIGCKLVVVGVASATLLLGGGLVALPFGVRTSFEMLLLLPALGLVLVNGASAAKVGRLLDTLSAAVAKVLRRSFRSRLEQSLPRLSAATCAIIRLRWRRLTFGSLCYALLQAALLSACLDVAGVDLNAATLAGALAVDRLLTLVPLTPGGLGVVEGGMVATLVALGAPAGPAVVGVILYRSFTYLAEIPVGGLLIAGWSLRRQDRAGLDAGGAADPALGAEPSRLGAGG
jgi:uncharacterized protein (TIRG00374 family)